MYNVMKDSDVRARHNLLSDWGFLCVICGRRFTNIACVTKEHIIPRSKAPKGLQGNIAPSHYQCNKLRETSSIILFAKIIDQIELNMNPKEFIAWLNKPVPSRIVPYEATTLLHKPACFELPETLPGM